MFQSRLASRCPEIELGGILALIMPTSSSATKIEEGQSGGPDSHWQEGIIWEHRCCGCDEHGPVWCSPAQETAPEYSPTMRRHPPTSNAPTIASEGKYCSRADAERTRKAPRNIYGRWRSGIRLLPVNWKRNRMRSQQTDDSGLFSDSIVLTLLKSCAPEDVR